MDHTRQLFGSQAATLQAPTLHQIDTILDQLNRTQVRVLLLIRGYEQGARGECRAKAQTIASKLGCSERTVKRSLSRLRALGLWERVRRRMRFTGRVLTRLGRYCAAKLMGVKLAPASAVFDRAPLVTPHLSPHNGEAEHEPKKSPQTPLRDPDAGCATEGAGGVSLMGGSADPESALAYRPPNRRTALTFETWNQLARWMDGSGSTTSWARCKIAQRAFANIRDLVERSREWMIWRTMGADFNVEWLLREAIIDAVRVGAKFGTVESATAYVIAILKRCVSQRRLPGA